MQIIQFHADGQRLFVKEALRDIKNAIAEIKADRNLTSSQKWSQIQIRKAQSIREKASTWYRLF